MNHATWGGALLALMVTGCVSMEKYDSAVADAQRAKSQLARHRADSARHEQALDARVAELSSDLSAAEQQARDRDAALTSTKAHAADLQKQLDDATALNQQLSAELKRLGKNVNQLVSEKGTMSSALIQAQHRLAELRRAQAAAEARAALFRQLALKFHRMVSAGQLSVVLRNGRMVLRLPNSVLFDSGRTTIKPAGKEALRQIAKVLKTIPNRRFEVAGHPIMCRFRTRPLPRTGSCRRSAAWRSCSI